MGARARRSPSMRSPISMPAANLDRDKSVNGALAAGIPGHPAALVFMAERYGRLPLKQSLAPAIRLAARRLSAGRTPARHAGDAQDVMLRYPRREQCFSRLANCCRWARSSRQPDLARTLESIADRGFDGFYEGKLARKLVDGVRAQGGNWTLDDLANYQAIEREPLRFKYRGHEVSSAHRRRRLAVWCWRPS